MFTRNFNIYGLFLLYLCSEIHHTLGKGNPKTGEKINRIKEVLSFQGRTQRWLCAQIGYSPQAVADMCNNITQPHLSDLKRIALILNVNIKELLYDTPVKK